MARVHVTEAESALMEALWRLGPLPPARLIAEVRSVRPWGQATIKTLLARLMHRKAIRAVREGGSLRYHPLIERADYVDAEVRALVDRLFDGDAAKLAALLATRSANPTKP